MALDVPGVYKLNVKLPERVDPEKTAATFNTNTHRMIVKLPIQC